MLDFFENYPSLKEIAKVDIVLENKKYINLLLEMNKKNKQNAEKFQKPFTGELKNLSLQKEINASWKRAMILFVALTNSYSVEETNLYLEKAGMAKLYPRDLFDSCIIYSLKNGISAKEFEDFYNKASIYLVNDQKKQNDGEITINKLKEIIKKTTQTNSSVTAHITDEISDLVLNCSNREEFFDFVANKLSPMYSETYQLQRRYVSLYLYYALMARAEEIYSFIEDWKNNGPLSKEILCSLNSREELVCNDYWHDFKNIINDKIGKKLQELENAVPENPVYGYHFRESKFSFDVVNEVLAFSISDPLSLFKSVISTKKPEEKDNENEKIIKEKIQKLQKIESMESFFDAPVSSENFWMFLYGVTSKAHEVKKDAKNDKKRANNNGPKLKKFINGETSFSRSSFVFLLTSIAAYLDRTSYKIKNSYHTLSIERINEILINSHFAPLGTNDTVDIATLLYFYSKENNEDYDDFYDFFESIDLAEEAKIKTLVLSEFNIEKNKDMLKEGLRKLK